MSAVDETELETELEGELETELETELEGELETELEGELEGETETEPIGDKEIEKLSKRLEGETNRHTNRVSEIMAEDALHLVKCEVCEPTIQGFHWPADALAPDDERRSLYEMLAVGAVEKLEHPSRYKTCPDCGGYGKVLTGSKEPLNVTKVCPNVECRGSGYIDSQAQGAPVVALAPGTPVEPEAAPVPDAQADMVGRPPGHPNYGILPIYLNDAQKALDARDGYTLG